MTENTNYSETSDTCRAREEWLLLIRVMFIGFTKIFYSIETSASI